MKLKLALIFSVIVVGLVIFAPEPFNPLKYTTLIMDKAGEQITGLKNDVNKIENGVDNTVDNIGKKIDNVKDSTSQLFSGDKITGEQKSETAEEYTYHGEITESAQSPTQNEPLPTNDGITPDTTQPPDSVQPDTTPLNTDKKPELVDDGSLSKETLQSKLLKTLQLTTTQQDNGDVKVKYSDSSGNTLSVKFTLKNSEKELFSGTFYASNFETIITDVTNTDHIIEMVIEHKEFGTITSSVFQPAGNMNTMINGVFMTP